MQNIRCILVDDEPPAIDLLQKYASLTEQLEVVGTTHSAVKAFDMLKVKSVDLMFLDIQMPVLNGIDFIKTLKHPPAIILTTAYREYAIDGYDLDIIDYLLKPIAFDRFLKAVERYRERAVPAIVETVALSNSKIVVDHLFFNVNRTHHKVLLADILYIESLKDYVHIHTKSDKLLVKGNIGSIMKQLPTPHFVRIHRSFVIALAELKSYSQSEVNIAGQRLPIGLSYREYFLSAL